MLMKEENNINAISISLNKALLCLDCDTIFSYISKNDGTTCPTCGGRTNWYLIKFLDRKDNINYDHTRTL